MEDNPEERAQILDGAIKVALEMKKSGEEPLTLNGVEANWDELIGALNELKVQKSAH